LHHRGGPADDLLGGGIQRTLGLEQLPLLGVVKKCLHAVGDGVAGGLVPGDREQQEEHVELLVGQGAALELGAEQPGDDVLPRVGAVLGGQFVGVQVHLDRGDGAVFGRGLELGVVESDEPVGEVEDLRSVRTGDAHQLAQREQRHLGGHVLDEVALALGQRRVHDLVGELAQARLQRADGAGSERALHDVAQVAVLGRVHVE
jgi:hypothetical protein